MEQVPQTPVSSLSSTLAPTTAPASTVGSGALKVLLGLGLQNYRQLRCFSAKWYAWLEYSIKQDAVICQPCCQFSTDVKEDRFVDEGVKDWGHLEQFCVKHGATEVLLLCQSL